MSFIGIEKSFIHIEGNELQLSIKLSRPLGKEVGVSIYIFGYRYHDRPFKEMPKIHVELGEFKQKIYDRTKSLPEITFI